jgi:hypothetical protein
MNRSSVSLSPEDEPTPEEVFFVGFRVFQMSVEFAALPPVEQCQAMGSFNTAWELREDLLDGKHLLGQGRLTSEQEASIRALLAVVEQVQSLPGGVGLEQNLSAMQHPSWEPVRTAAARTLSQLAPVVAANPEHLGPRTNAA